MRLFVVSIIMSVLAGCATAAKPGPVTQAWKNPLPPSATVIEHGQRVYQTHCQNCHGERHDGYGPVATTLDPKPTDLRYGFNDSRRLYESITHGVHGSSMPSFEKTLSLTDRAATVWYLQTLPGNRPQLTASVPDRIQ